MCYTSLIFIYGLNRMPNFKPSFKKLKWMKHINSKYQGTFQAKFYVDLTDDFTRRISATNIHYSSNSTLWYHINTATNWQQQSYSPYNRIWKVRFSSCNKHECVKIIQIITEKIFRLKSHEKHRFVRRIAHCLCVYDFLLKIL